MSTATRPLGRSTDYRPRRKIFGTDRDDPLGLRCAEDPHAAITRGQYDRARCTDREIVALIIERLGEPRRRSDPAARIFRFSPAELAVLVDLERASG